MSKSQKSMRGFASMNPEMQRAIAKKGGEAVSENRNHMAEIGAKGGRASGKSRSKKPKETPSGA